MQTILIPPVPELQNYPQRMHLLLYHLLQEYRDYHQHYVNARIRGDYLILDNSAYELGESVNLDSLILKAIRLNVQELVAPDVLGNSLATIERTEAFLLALRQRERFFKNGIPRIMLVPHGQTHHEWVGCLEILLAKHHFYFPEKTPVVGIARRYEDIDGGLIGLVDQCKVKRTQRMFDVHLLGWGRDIWALGTIGHKHPWVRSVDSAKPFHLGMAGISINIHKPKVQYVGRPQDYFERKLSPFESSHVEHNISVFQKMAAGELHR